jgi:hypothetical protein
LPSSLTRVLSFACGSSPRLPVSVCGTGGSLLRRRAFLGDRTHTLLARRPGVTDLLRLPPALPSAGCVIRPRRARAPPAGTGLLTRCPSPAPLGLGLGPTNPTRTSLPSETLGFRRTGFSPVSRYSCHHSHSSQLQLTSQLAFFVVTTLPYCSRALARLPRASVPRFSPVTFSAQNRLTSELLRTLSRMAASKPTSWLSPQLHLVSHLAQPSGP